MAASAAFLKKLRKKYGLGEFKKTPKRVGKASYIPSGPTKGKKRKRRHVKVIVDRGTPFPKRPDKEAFFEAYGENLERYPQYNYGPGIRIIPSRKP